MRCGWVADIDQFEGRSVQPTSLSGEYIVCTPLQNVVIRVLPHFIPPLFFSSNAVSERSTR